MKTDGEFLDDLEARATKMVSPYVSASEWDRLSSLGEWRMPINIFERGEADLWLVPSKTLLDAVQYTRNYVVSKITMALTK